MATLGAQAWSDFSASAAWLEAASAEIQARYLNKWIGVYKSQIEAVADTFDGVDGTLTAKNIPSGDALVRFIGQKEMTLIL